MKITRRQLLKALACLPILAFPDTARAQEPTEVKTYLPLVSGDKMADFPCNGILDTFPVDGGPPPNVNWQDAVGYPGLAVSGGKLVNPASPLTGVSLWKTPFGANQEAFITISPLPLDTQSMVLGLGSDAAGVNQVEININRNDAGNDTFTCFGLAPITINLQDGDSIGIRVCSGIAHSYYRPVGGNWTPMNLAFWPGFSGGMVVVAFTDGGMSNFGGGNLDEDCCPSPLVTAVSVTTSVECAVDPILALVCANGDRLDLISWEAGFELDDPGWRPQVAQFKGGGSYSNSQIAEGQTLVAGEYDNVVETIPLAARGTSEAKCIQTYRRLQQFIKRASDYWKEPSEYDCVWLEVRPNGVGCRIGYARVVKASCVDFANPYGQPFFSPQAYSVADGLSLVVEREPLWRAVPPGEIIGPLYNLLKNPDFEDWNAGVADSQPDCWDDVEVGGITGTNARDTAIPKWGKADFAVSVTNSTGAGQAKGVTQVAEGTEDGQTYTLVGWVRNAGVTSGVGRILITSLLGNYEAYRKAIRHGWELATYVFTAGVGDVIGVNCEILSTAAGTVGTVYFDSLMLLKGDWEEEALAEILPYMTSSHVYNHWDKGAGHLNYVDAWEVPGDADAMTRLEVVNDTTPADYTNVMEKFGHVYVGQRRTGDVQNFQNDHDPPGVADATASSGDRMNVTPTPSWVDVTTNTIVGDGDVGDNVGRFRILARLYDAKGSGSPTLEARLAYWMGQTGAGVKYLTGVAQPQRAAWNMVNLTPNAAQIADAKFRSNFPGALSYSLQLRRPTGTGDARLDYVLKLPTDGGFLEAEVTPGLEKGVALVVDNTASNSVSAEGIRVGYNMQVTLSDYLPSAFCVFKGDLYLSFASDWLGGANGGIWKKEGGTWSKVYSTAGEVLTLEVWNGSLYALHRPSVGNVQLIMTTDGVSWSLASPTTRAVGYKLKAYAGKLWLGLDSGVAGFIYSWDGSVLTLEYTIPAGLSVGALEVYNGRLFVSTSVTPPGTIYSYSAATGWRLELTTTELSINSLQSFEGKLYAGTNDNGMIYAYDGTAWIKVYDDTAIGVSLSFNGMAVRDNLIIAAENGVTRSVLLKSEDGIIWSSVYDTGRLDSMWAIIIYNGDIYLGVLPAAGTMGTIYTFVLDKPYEYSIANYQMGGGQNGGFTAPNRRLMNDSRRHRWVISFDRSDGSNAIGDKALVGIGYVPRYLALLGEG